MSTATSVTIDGHEWSRSEMRSFAETLRDQHDANKQAHPYDRCEHCSYTRHPCDTYDLASMVLALTG